MHDVGHLNLTAFCLDDLVEGKDRLFAVYAQRDLQSNNRRVYFKHKSDMVLRI